MAKKYKNPYLSDYEAKSAIIEIGKRMYDNGFVAANDGNISVKVGPNEIWITPTGVSKGFMTADMLIKVDAKEGRILSGHTKPTSELRMHLRIYQENPEILAVTHAHPPIATSFAVAGIPLDKPILPEAIINLGSVPIASYAVPGSQELADLIAAFCKTHKAILLANHGVLTWGNNLKEAYFRLETVEHYAKVLMYTKIIGKANELNSDQLSKLI
jgi:L-fuculose-phosphate aldolase